MGRGLSDLQKQMLVLALDNYDPDRGHSGADLYHKEVMVVVYGIAVLRYWPHDNGQTDREYVRQYMAELCMDRSDKRAYNSASTAISRAVGRLQDRGLVQGMQGNAWAGMNLTPAGVDMARSLSVKTPPNSDPSKPIETADLMVKTEETVSIVSTNSVTVESDDFGDIFKPEPPPWVDQRDRVYRPGDNTPAATTVAKPELEGRHEDMSSSREPTAPSYNGYKLDAADIADRLARIGQRPTVPAFAFERRAQYSA